MEDVIIVIILLAIAAGIIFYIYKAKKSGQKCIGCPYSKQCGSKSSQCDSYCCSYGCGKKSENKSDADSVADKQKQMIK